MDSSLKTTVSDSNFAISKTSFTNDNSSFEDSFILFRQSFARSPSFPLFSRIVSMPIMPLIGVLMSWDMLFKKEVLALLALCASTSAFCNSCCFSSSSWFSFNACSADFLDFSSARFDFFKESRIIHRTTKIEIPTMSETASKLSWIKSFAVTFREEALYETTAPENWVVGIDVSVLFRMDKRTGSPCWIANGTSASFVRKTLWSLLFFK